MESKVSAAIAGLRSTRPWVPSLKEEQMKALTALAERRNVFAVLPTGFGKSLIYGLLPLIYDEVRMPLYYLK